MLQEFKNLFNPSVLSKHSGKTGWRRKASGLGLEGQLGLCRGREFRKGSRKYSASRHK